MSIPRRFDWKLFLTTAALSVVAMLPLFRFSIHIHELFRLQMGTIVDAFLPVLLLLPLPIAYVAVISRDRFRHESLGTVFAAVFATQGTLFAAVAGGLVLGAVLTSFKAHSIFHGDNPTWTYFRSTGSAVFVLAVAIGMAAVFFFNANPGFQEDVRGNITERAVATAVDYAGGGAMMPGGGGEAGVTGLAGQMAENISVMSITATESMVFQAVAESGQFNQMQRGILRDAFSMAEDEVPQQLQDQAVQQLDTGFGGQDTERVSMTDAVEPRVRSVVDQFSEPSLRTSAILFFAVFSIIMLFKIPFKLVGTVYGTIIDKILAMR